MAGLSYKTFRERIIKKQEQWIDEHPKPQEWQYENIRDYIAALNVYPHRLAHNHTKVVGDFVWLLLGRIEKLEDRLDELENLERKEGNKTDE